MRTRWFSWRLKGFMKLQPTIVIVRWWFCKWTSYEFLWVLWLMISIFRRVPEILAFAVHSAGGAKGVVVVVLPLACQKSVPGQKSQGLSLCALFVRWCVCFLFCSHWWLDWSLANNHFRLVSVLVSVCTLSIMRHLQQPNGGWTTKRIKTQC